MRCLETKAQIDPMVCTTRVGLHYKSIKPTLLKVEYVCCEWPLASKVNVAEELHAVAKENKARTIIGLQGELCPVMLKVKPLIEQDNRVENVMSSSVVAAAGSEWVTG